MIHVCLFSGFVGNFFKECPEGMSLEHNNSPPLPPPLPPLDKQANSKHSPVNIQVFHHLQQQNQDSTSDVSDEEIEKLLTSLKSSKTFCTLLEDDPRNLKAISVLNPNIRSLIQEGPTCGIIALVMACQVLSSSLPQKQSIDSLSLDDVLREGIRMNVTKQGEMFSGWYPSIRLLYPDVILFDKSTFFA